MAEAAGPPCCVDGREGPCPKPPAFRDRASIYVDFMRFAQALWEAYGHGVRKLAEDVAKTAPVGSGSAVAALNSTITATSKLHETLHETGRQAAEVTRSSFDVAVMAVPGTARRTIGQRTRRR